MKFNSQICTSIEHSRRLLELGLKKETADMLIMTYSTEQDIIALPWSESGGWTRDNSIPAWSLHRLIEIMGANNIQHWLGLNVERDFDLIIDTIEELIIEGYFPKEYLV